MPCKQRGAGRNFFARLALTLIPVLLMIVAVVGVNLSTPERAYAEGREAKISNLGEAIITTKDETELITSKFRVDGEMAFCMEFFKKSPTNIMSGTETEMDDENLLKALYYGYGGPAEWTGLKGRSDAECQVLMTALLSDVKPSDYDGGTELDETKKDKLYAHLEEFGYSAFKSYVLSQKLPKTSVEFDKKEVKGYYSKEEACERTEYITIKGTSGAEVVITIPAGCKLCAEGQPERSGTAKLKVGDSFYIKSEGSALSTEISAAYMSAQPYAYVTKRTDYQDLIRLKTIEKNIKLDICWPRYVHLGLLKMDSESGEKLEGVKFKLVAAEDIMNWTDDKVMYEAGSLVTELVTDVNGYATSGRLPEGKYSLVEESTLDGYILDNTVRTYELKLDEGKKEQSYTVNIYNIKEETPPEEPEEPDVPEVPDKPDIPDEPTKPQAPEEIKTVDTGDDNELARTAELLLSLVGLLVLTLVDSCDKL